jgi:ABC-2 type transport system ATP-binding protein
MRFDEYTATGTGSEVLLAEKVRKSYGDRTALEGLSFSLGAGRVLGFLGPNGAGKTTAIRILTTILKPTSGRFVVDGIGSEYPMQVRSKIGVLPENLGFRRRRPKRKDSRSSRRSVCRSGRGPRSAATAGGCDSGWASHVPS